MKEYTMYKLAKEGNVVIVYHPSAKDIYEREGYVLTEVIHTDMETALNTKLNLTVQEYLENEEYRSEVISKYSRSEMDRNTFYDTVRLVDDWKWTILSRLDRQVSRLMRYEYQVNNEVAVQLYDGLHGNNSLKEVLL